MDLNNWKENIIHRYAMLQTKLKNNKQNAMYKHIEKAIKQHDIEKNYSMSYRLNEWLDTHFEISDTYIQLYNLHQERLEWLKVYTNNNTIKNTEYYRQLAYKCIHEDYFSEDIAYLIKEAI